MGSVIDYIDCPNCGNQAMDEYYYKTGEQYANCNHCGYHRSVTIKNKTKKITELVEDDYEVVEIKNPYAAYRVKQKGFEGTLCGGVMNYEELQEFIEEVYENRDDITEASYSRLIDGQIVITELIKNGE